MKRKVKKLLKIKDLHRNLSHYEIQFSISSNDADKGETVKFSKDVWDILPDAFFYAIIYAHDLAKKGNTAQIDKLNEILEQFSLISYMNNDFTFDYSKFNLFTVDKDMKYNIIDLPSMNDIDNFLNKAVNAYYEFN